MDSWLTEREQDQRAQKLEQRGQDIETSHTVAEQTGFPYNPKLGKGTLHLTGPILTGPPEQYRLSAAQLGNRASQPDHKYPRESPGDIEPIPKQTSREFLLGEFDAALKKMERAKVPESLTFKDEDEEEKEDPRPMVISPTLLTSNKIMERSIPKAPPSKPIILSRASVTSKVEDKVCHQVKISQHTTPDKLFPGVGNAVTIYRSKRVKHVDKGPVGGGKVFVSSGLETVQPGKPKLKVTETASRVVHSVENSRNVTAQARSTVDDHLDEIFPPEYNAGKKVSEAKKKYKMSGSLRELQPKAMSNAPPKAPSPVRELLKDFIKEREIKKTLFFDVNAWKSKVNDPHKTTPMPDQECNKQNKKMIESFSSYDPPRLPGQHSKPLSFTESLKSVDNYQLPAHLPPNSNQHSLLAELNSNVSPEPGHKPTITILQAGYQASPGKVSLQETGSILSTSMELCETYPESTAPRISHVSSPSVSQVSPSISHVTSSISHVTPPTCHVTSNMSHVSSSSFSHESTNMAPPLFSHARSSSSAHCSTSDSPISLFAKRNVGSTVPPKIEENSETSTSSPSSVSNVSNHCLRLPDKNICSKHYLNEFLNFQYNSLKIKSEVIDPAPTVTIVKVEPGDTVVKKESPSSIRSKRKSAIIASQNLVEKVYKVSFQFILVDFIDFLLTNFPSYSRANS